MPEENEILKAVYELRSDVKLLADKLDQNQKIKEDHETRIRALEKKVFWAAGIAAVAGGSLGNAGNFISKIFGS